MGIGCGLDANTDDIMKKSRRPESRRQTDTLGDAVSVGRRSYANGVPFSCPRALQFEVEREREQTHMIV